MPNVSAFAGFERQLRTNFDAQLTLVLSQACLTMNLRLACIGILLFSHLAAACERWRGHQSAAEHEASPGAVSVASGVAYSIIRSSSIPGKERRVDIRLPAKLSADVLRALALRLKAEDPRSYELTRMSYYLPGMSVDASPWAMAHFQPRLELRILGLTVTQTSTLLAAASPAADEIAGRWLEETSANGHRLVVFRRNGRLFLESRFPDGRRFERELIENRTPWGVRFDAEQGSPMGNHWVLTADGNLQVRDRTGLIATALRIPG